MNSTSFLRRGIATTPPLPAAGLPLTFRRNVSSSTRVLANENIISNKHGSQIIRCVKFSRTPSSGSSSGGFPFGNAKMALQSLLCFSLDTAAEPETRDISAQKKRALQSLLAQNPEEAEKIITTMYKKYQRASGTLKYDATLAFVEILIHMGTVQSLDAAIRHMNDIEEMTGSLPSDAKRFLYRAVIYTLLEENLDAKNFWKTYMGIIGSGPKR